MPALYKDSQQTIIGYLQLGFGLGNMLGSTEGSFFYELGGYTLPFYVNSAAILLCIPLIIKFIPSNAEMNEF